MKQMTRSVYDADKQVFPLILRPENQESIFVPRVEAKQLKENFSHAEKIATFGLQLDAKNHAKEYLISGKVTYQGKTYEIENREMNVARAMSILYGNYSTTKHYSKWMGEAKWDEPDADYHPFEAIPIFNKPFRENDTNKFILVTGYVNGEAQNEDEEPRGEDNFGDCHTCSVKIGMAVFSQHGVIWKLELGQKDIGSYGESGNPPKASLVKIGKDRYALMFSGYWTNNLGEGVPVDFIDRVNGIFKEIFSLATKEVRLSLDTTGGYKYETETSYSSRIEYIQGCSAPLK